MFGHFLVPLDGSRMAEAALPAAAFLAAKLRARVTLFHVVESDPPAEVHGQTHLRDAEDAGRYLDAIAKRAFAHETRVDCHVHAPAADDVAASIVAHAAELHHDLVVMCSHGRGQALHLFLGSIAQKVIGQDSRPVLITHPDAEGEAPTFACRRILLPLDGDPAHGQALPVAKELARSCSASLFLVNVIPSLATLSGEMVATSRILPGTTNRMLELAGEEAAEYLEAEVAALQGEGIPALAQVLRGDPAKMLISVAGREEIDLIVLATHGKTGLTAFWAGSLAHKICGYRQVPLLLIPIAKE